MYSSARGWGARAAIASIAYTWILVAAHAQDLPDGPGKAETETQCSTCHSMSRVTSHKDSLEGWRSIVDNMVGMGAMFTDEDKELIVSYLFKSFPDTPAEAAPDAAKPDSPASQSTPAVKVDASRIDIKLGEGVAAEFITEACTQCHALSRLTSKGGHSRQEWTEIVEDKIKRGAQLNDLKRAMVIDYLTAAFPK